MIRRMATVRVAKAVKMKNRARLPAKLFILRPMWITMVQSTSDSSEERERQKKVIQAGYCGSITFGGPCTPSVCLQTEQAHLLSQLQPTK